MFLILTLPITIVCNYDYQCVLNSERNEKSVEKSETENLNPRNTELEIYFYIVITESK
jgi:hypothetical protein